MKWKTLSAVICCTAMLLPNLSQAAAQQSVNDRVEKLLAQMTQDEKLNLLNGTGYSTRAIPRLGIPAVEMDDGPQGVRGWAHATAFPCGICMASTWDTALIGKLGAAIGSEVAMKGAGVILGPCVNIHRTPLGGRNCESFSEDPYLAARMAVAYIKGVQSAGSSACVKHYACNDQETERGSINVLVDERALREIYLPAFRAAATEAHVWSLMSSYNCINGPHASADAYLLNGVLKKEWGWDGMVMSDWGGVHETAAVLNAGNDLEMPGGDFLTQPKLQEALDKGEISQKTVDESVRRVLRFIVRTGLMDSSKKPAYNPQAIQAHRQIARKVASEGVVLLKNDRNILPLNSKKIKSIAVIGPNADVARTSVSGSGYVPPVNPVAPLDAIKRLVSGKIQINFAQGIRTLTGAQQYPVVPEEALQPSNVDENAHGLRAEYFANKTFQGSPALTRIDNTVNFNWTGKSPAPQIPNSNYSVRWTGSLVAPKTGDYEFWLTSDDGSRLYIDNQLVVDNWGDHATQAKIGTVELSAGKKYSIRVDYYNATGDAMVSLQWLVPGSIKSDSLLNQAVKAAAESDVAVVFAGVWDIHEGEGVDRSDFNMPQGQNELIKAVAKANKNTVVVLFGGTTCDMTKWIGLVPSVLQAWYPGVECGNALADVLFGNVNPSGKLPDTFGRTRKDYPDYGNFPGKDGKVNYAEGIFVGYRHFDKAKITPQFAFGHGLSYTTFKYSNIKLSNDVMRHNGKVKVSLTVANTGAREGAEVVQLYVGEIRPTVPRPVRELKGFQRVNLKPGEKKTVTFEIDESALSFYNVAAKKWKANSGAYEISVGSSSRDLRLKKTLKLE